MVAIAPVGNTTARNAPRRIPAKITPVSATTRQPLDAMALAFAKWLRHANRSQAAALQCLSARFDRDIAQIAELASCADPDDVFGLDADVTARLVADYMAEGARLFELLRREVPARNHAGARGLSSLRGIREAPDVPAAPNNGAVKPGTQRLCKPPKTLDFLRSPE